MIRAARGILVGAAIAAATLLAMTASLYYRPVPTIDGYFRLLGLDERVEVIRDEFGIAHLFASDDHDLWFLQGYVTAQDRLTQLEVLRAAARAQAGTVARAAAERATPAVRATLEAYAAGVTKLVSQYATARALPGELVLAGDRPAPWQPADSLAIAATYAERLDPLTTCASAAAARTLKGRPILASDLRAPLAEPGWYEMALEGDGFRAAGLTIPGVPGIIAGHNGWVAWSLVGSSRTASDPAATVGALLGALPARSARTFADAMRSTPAVATCLADIGGRIGATDRGQISFVEAERPGVIGGDEARAADLETRLGAARGIEVETMRLLLGRPAGPAGARVIVDLGDVDLSRSVVSRGVSGLRSAPHFGDQTALWELGQLHRLPFSRARLGVMDGDLVLRAR